MEGLGALELTRNPWLFASANTTECPETSPRRKPQLLHRDKVPHLVAEVARSSWHFVRQEVALYILILLGRLFILVVAGATSFATQKDADGDRSFACVQPDAFANYRPVVRE